MAFEVNHSFLATSAAMPERQRFGFSLIELLAALAAVSILAAILIPIVGQVRGKAHDTECLANMRQVGITMNMYANDHDDRYPSVYPADSTTWRWKLMPYLGMDEREMGPAPLPVEAGAFVCPSFNKANAPARAASYVINGQMRPEYSARWDYRRSAVVSPGNTVLLLEYDRNTEQFLYAWGDLVIPHRHTGSYGHYIFVDGHAERLAEQIPRGDRRWLPIE